MITFTLQQALDTVVEHLNSGSKEQNSGPYCLYRGPKGAKCFIGIMIPDDAYDPTWDKPAGAMAAPDLRIEKIIPDIPALDDLQRIHDDSDNWYGNGGSFSSTGWGKLKLWAKQNSLDYPVSAPNS
jgi:hypothetical protein